ncbi:MAG: transketolase [Christensenellaceae bacterium]|jgi:transketolase|nr:transketolase [Christensenellaceae bacterium]
MSVLTKQEWIDLETKVAELRDLCMQTTQWGHGGHWGGSSSVADILAALYFKSANFDFKKYDDPDRDRIVVSKGHAGIMLASLFSVLGSIPREDLKTFNLTGSKLGVHLDSNKVKGIDASTGSLGHGSSLALGMALAGRVQGRSYKSYVILGDGECDEGSVWEAAMAGANFYGRGAENYITIVDRNKCMIDGPTEKVMKLEPFADKWRAFGYEVIEVDGHNFPQLINAIETAKADKAGKPYAIIANTLKGYGVAFAEDNYLHHYGMYPPEKCVIAREDLAKVAKARLDVAKSFKKDTVEVEDLAGIKTITKKDWYVEEAK